MSSQARSRAHMFFAEGSAAVRGNSRALPDGLSVWLRIEPRRRIALQAHASARNSDPAAARSLASACARSVRDALLTAGVAERQIDDGAGIALHSSDSATPLQTAIAGRVDEAPLPEPEPAAAVALRRAGVPAAIAKPPIAASQPIAAAARSARSALTAGNTCATKRHR